MCCCCHDTMDHSSFCSSLAYYSLAVCAAGYNGPFYNSAGVQLGTFTNSAARITSNTVITQVLPEVLTLVRGCPVASLGPAARFWTLLVCSVISCQTCGKDCG